MTRLSDRIYPELYHTRVMPVEFAISAKLLTVRGRIVAGTAVKAPIFR
jgi:hypothetical protein